MKFGDKLIALRKKTGMSQEDLAEKLGVSRQSVSKWESNNTYPETDKIVQICNIFDCSMDDLINENIETIDNIERKNKNNLNVVFDSFLEFITKTVNMFSDMKFTSGLKCVIEMLIIAFVLFLASAAIVSFTDYVISDLFIFVPNIISNIFCQIVSSIVIILLVIVSVIILIHIFKIRYLEYYDKVSLEVSKEAKEEEKIKSKDTKKKINFEKKEKVIIRDEKHRPFAFLSILSKIIIIFIKIMLMFFIVGLVISLLTFVILFVMSISLITTHLMFIGSTIALISSIIINVIVLLMIINFIFDKKSNYKLILVIFMTSLILFGVGAGISIVSFKNVEIKEGEIMNTIKEENVKYNDDMIFVNNYLDDIEYRFDDNLKDKVKLIIKYDNRFYTYSLDNYNEYNMNETYISLHNNINIPKMYNEVIKDLKNNIIRDYINEDELSVTIVSSKENIDKIIDNTKKIYFVDVSNAENGYLLSNFEHRISGYNACAGNYDAKINEISTDLEGCACEINEEKTNRGNVINYSCDWD